MKISRRGFLAKGGMILLATQAPLGVLAAGAGRNAEPPPMAEPVPKDHVEAWRRFMEGYKMMC
jgi:hypothetical protein